MGFARQSERPNYMYRTHNLASRHCVVAAAHLCAQECTSGRMYLCGLRAHLLLLPDGFCATISFTNSSSANANAYLARRASHKWSMNDVVANSTRPNSMPKRERSRALSAGASAAASACAQACHAKVKRSYRRRSGYIYLYRTLCVCLCVCVCICIPIPMYIYDICACYAGIIIDMCAIDVYDVQTRGNAGRSDTRGTRVLFERRECEAHFSGPMCAMPMLRMRRPPKRESCHICESHPSRDRQQQQHI